MFIGRKEERKQLEEIYASDRSNLLILYGRIGIGKTALINEFISDKKAVVYTGRECTEREQKLRILGEFEKKSEDSSEDMIPDYYSIFTGLLDESYEADTKKQLFILDEFHYLANNSVDFIEAMLKITSENDKKRMVILTSSSINWIEQSMVSVLGTVSRKITGFMKLKPLTFAELVEWFPKSSVEDCIVINSVLGGIPRYLTSWQENRRNRENIIQLIMTPTGRFYDEPEFVLKTELRELAAYNSILYAMAAGMNKLNDIYHHTGFSRAKISVYIKNLIQMDIVEKIFSFETKDRTEVQKGLYRIKDNFINFWYRYVFPYKSAVETGKSKWIYDNYIEQDSDTYMRHYFAEVCNEYLKLMNMYKRLKYEYSDFGSWYGKKGKLDIVMQDKNKNSLAAICIWNNSPCDTKYLDMIKELSEAAGLKVKEIFIFSKSGFSSGLTQIEKTGTGIHLVPLSSL